MADAPTGSGQSWVDGLSPDGESVPPAAVRAAALRAFDLRIPGARIADAVYDSWVDPLHAMPPGPRLLRFACPGRIVEVGVFPRDAGCVLRLRTTPSAAMSVEVRQQEASVTFVTGDDGILDIDPSPTGVLCFVVRAEGESPVQTAWVRV